MNQMSPRSRIDGFLNHGKEWEISEISSQRVLAVADLRGGGPPPPLRPKIVTISCIFLQNLAELHVVPPEGLAPPMGNPGSAPDQWYHIQLIPVATH